MREAGGREKRKRQREKEEREKWYTYQSTLVSGILVHTLNMYVFLCFQCNGYKVDWLS